MSQYLRWMKIKSKDDEPFPYVKRRSNSLDPGSLDVSELRNFTVVHTTKQQQLGLRQKSLDPERRRQSIGPIPNIHRASDAFLDPQHAAILFRDSRGLPVVDPFLENINLSDLEDETQILKF
ncbi:hypothetical protein JTB14_009801 [Gonioctena quinquepunctata]|nr:hypothetical protein JTB14_009801 [Gonioctena quinquepunctata]